MQHLVVYFGEGDIAVDVETDFQKIRELGEPLTPLGGNSLTVNPPGETPHKHKKPQ